MIAFFTFIKIDRKALDRPPTYREELMSIATEVMDSGAYFDTESRGWKDLKKKYRRYKHPRRHRKRLIKGCCGDRHIKVAAR